MPSQKLMQLGLWIANAAVALAIVVLSLVWFVFSKAPNPGLEVVTAPRRGPVSAQPDRGSAARLQVAATLPNPMEPPPPPVTTPAEPPLSQSFAVSSTSYPQFAMIILKGTQFSFSARLNEVLAAAKLSANIPQREFLNGWKVVEIHGYPDEYVVLERGGSRVTLTKKDSATAAAAGVAPPGTVMPPAQSAADLARYRGQPYNSAQYQTYQRGATWFVDPEEINWAVANQATVLANDVRLSPAEGGGVRVDFVRAGSVLESRGLQQGDTVTEINRRRIEGPQQMNELMQWLSGESPQQVYIRLNRAGRAIVLVYRPAPRPGQ